MNIRQYYQHAATASLNGSFAALIPVFVIIIPLLFLIDLKEVVLLASPFLLYSFISYQIYLIHQHRFLASEVSTNSHNHGPIERNQYLLTFMPAPSLRLLLFTPDGHNNVEILDKRYSRIRWFLPYFIDKLFPAEYELYQSNKLLITVKWTGKHAVIVDEDGKVILEIETKDNVQFLVREKGLAYHLNINSKKLFTDIQFFYEDNSVQGRVRKGWMPMEWAKHFGDANTPVLTFHDEVSKAKRLAMLAILIKLYRYHNH